MSFFHEINRIISASTFCYARPEGQGFVDKSECPCFINQVRNCEAYMDKEEFHTTYSELQSKGLTRKEIMDLIRDRFKDSQWFKDNVKEEGGITIDEEW